MTPFQTKSIMKPLFSIVLFMFVFAKATSAAAVHGDDHWCYKDISCATWKAGLCQTGKVQSPVDFNKDNTKENKTEIRMRFNKEYMDLQPNFLVKNNGHTIQIQLNDKTSSNLLMDGDGLNGEYVFSQLHFHWGSQDDKGSEHTVEGKAFPLELHLVHYNGMYKGLGEAVASKNSRGLAVLGIFFELSDHDNGALKPIIDSLSKSRTVADDLMTMSNGLNVSALLPTDLKLFRYYGSLTTPACFEVVHWNVFNKTVPISKAQLEEFRKIKDDHGDPLVDNYRPTMPMAGRQVQEFDVVDFALKPASGAPDNHKTSPDSKLAPTGGVSSTSPSSTDAKKNAGEKLNFGVSILGLTAAILLLQLKHI